MKWLFDALWLLTRDCDCARYRADVARLEATCERLRREIAVARQELEASRTVDAARARELAAWRGRKDVN